MNNKPTKIFITHSAKDEDYVLLFTELLRGLKIPNECIVCTSDHRHKIPNGENSYAWLRKQFVDSNIHMIFILSKNYFDSNPSLNEMGAAWIVATKSDILLLPGFTFNDFQKEKGCLDKDIQSGSFESEDRMIKAWLNNLRDDIIKEFNLEKPDDLDWEEIRDNFIERTKAVVTSKDIESVYNATDIPIVDIKEVETIPADSAVLLVYAASNNGEIIKIRTLGSPIQISAAGKQFMADNSERESARWEEALDRLVVWGWVKPVGYKGEIYKVTGTGYQKADWLKEGMGINTNNEPVDELKAFGG